MPDARSPRMLRLIQAPNLGGDLLLIGLYYAAQLDFGLPAAETLTEMAATLWSAEESDRWRLLKALQGDVRAYRPHRPRVDQCGAPMLRRTGTCGQRSTVIGAFVTDWSTGEKTWVAACGRHRVWFDRVWRENLAAKPADPPLPAADCGGVLAAHFPELDWPEFWRRIQPWWVEHPEPVVLPRPRLRILPGEGAQDPEMPRSRSLVLVPDA